VSLPLIPHYLEIRKNVVASLLDDKITSRKSQIRNSEEFIFISNKPSLLIVISNKWVVHISQPSLDNAFHDLKQKWLMLGVNILNTLLKNSE